MIIIRALWGNLTYIKNEIPKSSLFNDEIVFVWGLDNFNFLKSLGYKTILVDKSPIDSLYNNHLIHFAHKLKAIKLADSIFKEYLFLDWDVTLAKDIDDNFYNLVRSGNIIQCPVYAYHKEYKNDSINYHKSKSNYTEDLDDFLFNHILNLDKYNWSIFDIKVVPCFCYFYSNEAKIGAKLLEIMNNFNIKTCIEEFCLQIYCDCTLDEYINKYEPIVIRGKEKDKNLPRMTDALVKINKYVDSKIEKNIYLLHDLI